MADTIVKILSHQAEFLRDTRTPEIMLCGGYGCGKSFSICMKAVDLASKNIGFKGAIIAPTSPMLRDTSIADMEAYCESIGVNTNYRASPLPEMNLHFPGQGHCKILFRSGLNWKRLRSLNLAFILIDEIDTDSLPPGTAEKLWRMAQSRLRRGNVRQLAAVTTPEGYGFAYDFFGKNPPMERRLIRAKTQDNPFLPDSYIENLLKSYPPNMIRSYLDGEFCNAISGNVYESFDRHLNNSNLTLEYAKARNLRLYIGIDFNVRREGERITGMSAVTHIKDEAGNPHAIDEIMGSRDTFALGEAIRAKYPWCNPKLIPDASAKNRSTKGATLTDISLLEDQGHDVEFIRSNPLIRDRVKIMNAMFLNGKGERRYRVNANTCPTYVECLEKQAIDQDGSPEKGKFDGPNDAGGYYIFYDFGQQMERTNWI